MYGTGISQEVGNGGQVCGDVEAVGFSVQNVYKMMYGDENATFESRFKRETWNGYGYFLSTLKDCFIRSISLQVKLMF